MRAAQWEALLIIASSTHMITAHDYRWEWLSWLLLVLASLVLLVGFLPELPGDD